MDGAGDARQLRLAAARLGERTVEFARSCERAGVVVRPFAGEGVRVTIGESEANDLFLKAAEAFRKSG